MADKVGGGAAPAVVQRGAPAFTWEVRVYYEDTDSGGVVYHANYLRFMERARTEWLRSLGFEQDALLRGGVLLAVRAAALDFLRPAYFNQLLRVSAEVGQHGHASLTFVQEVRTADAGQLLCAARVKIACLNPTTMRPRRIPSGILAELT
jgi:acyl-CoA thioester hydrolase